MSFSFVQAASARLADAAVSASAHSHAQFRVLSLEMEESVLSEEAVKLSLTLTHECEDTIVTTPVQVLDGARAPLPSMRLRRVTAFLEASARLLCDAVPEIEHAALRDVGMQPDRADLEARTEAMLDELTE